ncbi:hypothetical protein BGZ68_003595, partial [Mortierella alpina]
EVIEEKEAEIIIAREKEIVVEDKKVTETTTTTIAEEEVTLEHVTKETVVVEETTEQGAPTEQVVITEKETGVVAKPAVSEKSSWFRRVLNGAATAVTDAASGAGQVASGALEKVDGVWKRTVKVLTIRKAHVDHVCPIAKTSYVYFDDDVYDSVLIEKSTGITYVTQLIYDSETKVYYVYYRWGETEYTLDGPHETVESAKEAFQVSYKEKFDVEWKEREIATNDRWTYETKTYETFEEIEEVEEVVEETQAALIISREKEMALEGGNAVQIETSRTEIQDDVVVQHVQEKVVVVDEEVQSKETVTETTEEEQVKVEVSIENVVDSLVISEPEQKQEVVKEHEVVDTREIITETGVIAQPAVTQKSSWFRKVLGSGAAVAAGVAGAAIGAGAVASGALSKVDGVWKRTVQVLTTRKAHVDHLCPIAKTSYVYYDDEVYDSVL